MSGRTNPDAQPDSCHVMLAGIALLAAARLLHVRHEEAMIRARFHDAWNAFCARGSRLFPGRVA